MAAPAKIPGPAGRALGLSLICCIVIVTARLLGARPRLPSPDSGSSTGACSFLVSHLTHWPGRHRDSSR